jgi:hypothetical protein
VDFRKLLEMTPQEREASRQAAQDAYERSCEERLATRRAQLAAALRLRDLNGKERDFLNGLNARAARPDHVVGRIGGELLYISDPQAAWLRDLAARAARRPTAPAARGGTDVISRMAAFRTDRQRSGDASDQPRANAGARRRGSQSSPDDAIVWPDGAWCFRHELAEMSHMSDDFEVVQENDERYRTLQGPRG